MNTNDWLMDEIVSGKISTLGQLQLKLALRGLTLDANLVSRMFSLYFRENCFNMLLEAMEQDAFLGQLKSYRAFSALLKAAWLSERMLKLAKTFFERHPGIAIGHLLNVMPKKNRLEYAERFGLFECAPISAAKMLKNKMFLKRYLPKVEKFLNQ